MTILTKDTLAKFCPRPKSAGSAQTNWDGYVNAMTSPEGYRIFRDFGIDTKDELCAFLANAAQETGDSGGFTCLWENLNFTTVAAIRGAWSARAKKYSDAWIKANLIRNPQAIGAWAYDGRMGNGIGNGDGYKYRGFGILQTTGKTAHMEYLAGDYSYLSALRAALMEWKDKDCDASIAAGDFDGACIKINGGRNGLAQRKQFLAKAEKIWTVNPVWDVPTAVADTTPAVPEEPVTADTTQDTTLPLPAPTAPVSISSLAQSSAKTALLVRVRNWLFGGAAGAGTLSVDSLLQTDGPANNFLTIIGQHPISVLLTGFGILIGGGTIAIILINYIVKDCNEGRYLPSGWSKDT